MTKRNNAATTKRMMVPRRESPWPGLSACGGGSVAGSTSRACARDTSLILMRLLRCTSAMEDAEHRRHEEKRRDRREEETADDRPSERSVLFGALSQSERHRDHSEDHRERGHDHGPEPRESGLDRRFDSVAVLGQLFLRERDEQDAVRGRDAH